MNSKNYIVQMEVSGPLALFARPDTGGAPSSYPVPTWTAAKGIFDAIAFYSDGSAWLSPTRVEICRGAGFPGGSVRYDSYVTNYGGPLRKADQIRNDNNMQLHATALSNVCYRLYAEVRGAPRRKHNPRHALRDMFVRRLGRGQCYRTPCLGWREFTCDYWGPLRAETEVDTELNLHLPSMLSAMWSAEVAGRYAPKFSQDLKVEAGVLEYT